MVPWRRPYQIRGCRLILRNRAQHLGELMKRITVASFVLAVLSFVAAVIAIIVSVYVWQRPIPADPRAIPTIGSVTEPFVIDKGAGGTEFFEFLDQNAGRKVRIVAYVDELGGVELLNRDGMTATGLIVSLNGDDGFRDVLNVKGATDGLSALYMESGTWRINGYFANEGLVSARMGVAQRFITAIDIVTAVS